MSQYHNGSSYTKAPPVKKENTDTDSAAPDSDMASQDDENYNNYYKKSHTTHYASLLNYSLQIYNFLRSRGIIKSKIYAAEIMNEKSEQSQEAGHGIGD